MRLRPVGRPSRVFAATNAPSSSAGPATPVVDLACCYSAGSVAPACSTVKTDDRSLVQWLKNAITGQVATYTLFRPGFSLRLSWRGEREGVPVNLKVPLNCDDMGS